MYVLLWILSSHLIFCCKANCDIQLQGNNRSYTLSGTPFHLSAQILSLDVEPNLTWAFVGEKKIVSQRICYKNHTKNGEDKASWIAKCSVLWQDMKFLLYNTIRVGLTVTNMNCNVSKIFDSPVIIPTPWNIEKVSQAGFVCATDSYNFSFMQWTLILDNKTAVPNISHIDIQLCDQDSTLIAYVSCENSTFGVNVSIQLNDAYLLNYEQYWIRCSEMHPRDFRGSRFLEENITEGTLTSVTPDSYTDDRKTDIPSDIHVSNPRWMPGIYIASSLTCLIIVLLVSYMCQRLKKKKDKERMNEIVNNGVYAMPVRSTSRRIRRETNDTDTSTNVCETSGTHECQYSLAIFGDDSSEKHTPVNPYSLAFARRELEMQPEYDTSRNFQRGHLYSMDVSEDEYAHLMTASGRRNPNHAFIQENPYSVADFDTEH